MTVIPVPHLCASDLSRLGHNVRPAVHRDRYEFAAINRSLATLGEAVGPHDDKAEHGTASMPTG